jgi:hypothetical protein
VRHRGRPILGAIAGLFLGALVAADLALFGVRPLDEIAVYGFPIAGLLLGLLIGLWAPLGRGRAERKAAQADSARIGDDAGTVTADPD